MKVCPSCGHESHDIDRFCLHCGHRLNGEGDAEAIPIYVPVRAGRDGTSTRAQSLGGAAGPVAQPRRPAAAREASVVAQDKPRPTNGGPVARLVGQPREGAKQGEREYALDGGEAIIGRAPSCDVVLADDQLASRRHTLLRYDEEREHYTAVDLGSSNGTYVNGIEIRDVVALADGDLISVGEHEFIYREAERKANPAASSPARSGGRVPSAGRAGGAVAIVPRPGGASGAAHPAPAADAPSPDATATPATPAPASAPPTVPAPAPEAPPADLDELQRRLAEVGQDLVRRAGAAEREAARLRHALGQAGQQVAALLATLGGAAGGDAVASPDAGAAGRGDELERLIGVARRVADQPPFLDAVTALAARAGDIARALEAQRGVAIALAEIADRLERAGAPPRQLPLAIAGEDGPGAGAGANHTGAANHAGPASSAPAAGG